LFVASSVSIWLLCMVCVSIVHIRAFRVGGIVFKSS
jgi:hypothetical protein